MRITEVESIILRPGGLDGSVADSSQDDLVVRVHTDAGIVGIGEVDSSPEVAKAIIDAPVSHKVCSGLRAAVLGQDPLAIEALWERMYQACISFGRRGAAIHALSGIDLALWDIKGKALGLPVYQLLGGPVCLNVRAYASMLMPQTPAETAREVERLAWQGFTAIKLGWGPIGQDLRHDIELVKAARQAAGDGVDIMIDAGLAYDGPTAIQAARRMQEYDVYWLEEPLAPDDLDGYARLADAVDLRIAAGEEQETRWAFRELVERGHIDVAQPDVTRTGGITEARRVADYVFSRGVACVPHSWGSGINKAATLHLQAALPHATLQEYSVAETPVNQHLVVQRFPLTDGYVSPPTGPGLGIELDEDFLRRYAVTGLLER